MYVRIIPKDDQQTFNTQQRHSLQFQNSINTIPCRYLLDTGASGTVSLAKAHYEKEGIALTQHLKSDHKYWQMNQELLILT
jgi:predicted aspartyl protease